MIRPHVLDTIDRVWGFRSLRPLQAEAMLPEFFDLDSLTVMATGSGKSLCYQAPALLRDGLTVVVSPLIALMRDQVEQLAAVNYPAACLHSGMPHHRAVDVERGVEKGLTRLLYMSPERVLEPHSIALHKRARVEAFVIDECHCVAQWGHDFRPDYGRLADLRRVFPDVPIHAYTATATKRTREEVIAALELRNPTVTIGPLDRPNLHYAFEDRVNAERQLLDFVSRRPAGEQGIVYCVTRADAAQWAEYLTLSGVGVCVPYHAGMDDEQREKAERMFLSGAARVIVSTSAFGMGVNKPDVRWVVHMALPPSVESYHQETGRAGRDGQPARCVCFWDEEDVERWMRVMSRGDGEPVPYTGDPRVQRLHEMHDFAENTDEMCRREWLEWYFDIAPSLEVSGDSEVPGSIRCTACDVCDAIGSDAEAA